MPAPSGERATLSRDLADFLIELSIALHKHAMYPEGHPSLAPAAGGVTRRAEHLFEERTTLALGVARQQLVIEGVATDPKNPLLSELAGRLHRHHLGAVTFHRGLRVTDDGPTAGTEPAMIAKAIGEHPRSAAYDQVIVGYLLQIADELKSTGGAEAAALRRRTSKLVGALQPGTLRRLIEMGGDNAQRTKFAIDATYGLAAAAVLDVVRAMADASHKTVSDPLLRMLSKLAQHAEQGRAEARPQADAALREQGRQLTAGDPPDFLTIDRLLPRLRMGAFEPLLDALAASESRTTRRGLLDRLTRAPRELGPVIAMRLAGQIPWYVTRNLLLILDGLPALPDGFSAAAFIDHVDARVRREAVKVSLKVPVEREPAL